MAEGDIQGIAGDSRLMEPEGQAGLPKGGTGVLYFWVFGQLQDKEVEKLRGLVPDDMVDGLIAIGNIFHIAGIYGSEYRFFPGYPDAESGMRKKDNDGVGRMHMGGGGVVHGNGSFEQSEISVFQ